MAFAVVDFETTGILPSYHHRVVELGVTHVDDGGTITGCWETLINPERDLGPQHIHGIRAADILDAPTFADVAPEFAGLLQGRVFAAHNASFDLRFLRAEFERAGYWFVEGTPSVCTMTLGSSFGLGGACSLSRACSTYAITHEGAHSAGADSHATAQLLGTYTRQSTTWPGWADYWGGLAAAARVYPYPSGYSRGTQWRPRAAACAPPASFLERISSVSERPQADGAAAQYLALLDRCLLDGHVSVSEGRELAEVAAELGLDRSAVDRIHADYYRDLERRAWADGVLTDDEKQDLRAVGALLQRSEAEIAAAVDYVAPEGEPTALSDHFALGVGDLIVLTGEMTRERSDWEAELRDRGFTPHSSVTKKVRLVVAADPDSLSGKAKKARDYGIAIVSEDGLRRLLEAADTRHSQHQENETP
ncbi:exonuclease domain-containing protein [Microbacterium sp.]|uniref:exonuclease domain-containing protein n=1 Tax=Microbacterium sp. TaxID=51671 RepID=UPI003C26B9F7